MRRPGPYRPLLPDFAAERAPGAPWVSVVTATWNAARTVGPTLESVAAQGCPDVEHLIVDGASQDQTLAIAAAARHRVRIDARPDHGIYDAFNRGLRLAQGEWITFLGSDDCYSHPTALAAVLALAERHPEADLIHGEIDIVDADGAVLARPRFYPKHPLDSERSRESYAGTAIRQVVFPATFMRRRLFARIGGFDATFRIAGDTELLVRAFASGATFRYLPRVLVRMGAGGVSHRLAMRAELEALRGFRRHATDPLGLVPVLQLMRGWAVNALERRDPRLVALARRVKGSPRLLPYGRELRARAEDRPAEEAPP